MFKLFLNGSLAGLPWYVRPLANQKALGYEAGDTNLYRYVGNDPATRLDPLGLAGITYQLVGEPDPSSMGLEDGIPAYRFSTRPRWQLNDMPKQRTYFVQGVRTKTVGIKADGTTWKPADADKDGYIYVVDSSLLTLTSTTTPAPDVSSFGFKEKEFRTKKSWILVYHTVEKQSGFSKLDWKPTEKSGSQVKKGVYDAYIGAIRPNFGKGSMTYSYLYLNCGNAKNLGAIEKMIPKDALEILKEAGAKIEKTTGVEILKGQVFLPKDPVVGTFKVD